jgi:hypothetical protein
MTAATLSTCAIPAHAVSDHAVHDLTLDTGVGDAREALDDESDVGCGHKTASRRKPVPGRQTFGKNVSPRSPSG